MKTRLLIIFSLGIISFSVVSTVYGQVQSYDEFMKWWKPELGEKCAEFQKKILEYAKIPHEPQHVNISSKEFYPSVKIQSENIAEQKKQKPPVKNQTWQYVAKVQYCKTVNV